MYVLYVPVSFLHNEMAYILKEFILNNLSFGDVVIFLGAGDITLTAKKFASNICKKGLINEC